MYPLQPQSSARFASLFTMYLPLIFKIVACVRKFHAVVLKEPVYLEARFNPKQTASFSLGELALPVRFQNQGLQGLPGQLSRIGAEPAGQFLGNFDRDDHVLLHFTRIPDDAAWAPPLSRPLPSSTTTMPRMESAGVGRRACGVAGVGWRVWGGGCGAAGLVRAAQLSPLRLCGEDGPAALPLVGSQNLLAQPDRNRGHFHQFVLADEFDGLLQVQDARRDQADAFIRGGGAHIGQLLFLDDVHV